MSRKKVEKLKKELRRKELEFNLGFQEYMELHRSVNKLRSELQVKEEEIKQLKKGAIRHNISNCYDNKSLLIQFQIDKLIAIDSTYNVLEEEAKMHIRELLEEAYKQWGIR